MTFVTGMFEQEYQIWSTPTGVFKWKSSNTKEKRLIFVFKTKEEAEAAKEAIAWAQGDVEIRLVHKPVEEIPLVDASIPNKDIGT